MRKEDLMTIMTNHINTFWWYALKMYKNYFMYNGDMYNKLLKNDEAWRSAIVSPTTHTFVNSVYNMLLENIVTVDMRTTNNEVDDTFDKEFLNEVIDIFIPYMEWQEGFTANMHSSWFDNVLLWSAATSVWWVSIDKPISYISIATNSIEKVQMKHSYPTWEYKSPFDHFFYGSQNRYDKRFFIGRKLYSKSRIYDIMKTYAKYCMDSEDDKKARTAKIKEYIQGNNTFYFSHADFDSIKNHMAFVWQQNGMITGSTEFNSSFFGRNTALVSITDDNNFSIKDKMVEVIYVNSIEWSKIFIAGQLLGTMPHSIPIMGTQEVNMKFKEIPWSFQGIGIGTVAAPIQQAFDDILNPRIDTVIMAASPMYIQNTGASLFANKKVIKARPWMIMTSADPKNAMVPVPIQSVDGSAYRETDALMAMGNGATGISTLSLWLQQKVERVSWSVAMLKASTDNALNPIITSNKIARGEHLKRALILCKTSWDEKAVEKVFGPNSKFSQISLDKLVNNYDFIYSMTNEALDSKTADITQLMKILDFVSEQEQQGKKTTISSQKLTEIILDKLNTTYGDLSEETVGKVNEMSQDPQFLTDVAKTATGLTDTGVEEAMREMQGTGVGDIPWSMTTNANGKNTDDEIL